MSIPEGLELPDPHWSIDRRIPLALIVTLLVQFSGFIWWFSSVESRLTMKEQRLARVEQRLDDDQRKKAKKILLKRQIKADGPDPDGLRRLLGFSR